MGNPCPKILPSFAVTTLRTASVISTTCADGSALPVSTTPCVSVTKAPLIAVSIDSGIITPAASKSTTNRPTYL